MPGVRGECARLVDWLVMYPDVVATEFKPGCLLQITFDEVLSQSGMEAGDVFYICFNHSEDRKR